MCCAGSVSSRSSCARQFRSVRRAALFQAGVNYAYNSLLTSHSGAGAESNQNGASICGQYFFRDGRGAWGGRRMFSVIGEFAGSGSGSGSLYTYQFGPRWGIEWRHVLFYGQFVTVGGSHVRINGVNSAGIPVVYSRNSFAYGFGTAGIEVILGSHYALRLLQIDNIEQEVPDPSTGKSHWQLAQRLSGGIAFRVGRGGNK